MRRTINAKTTVDPFSKFIGRIETEIEVCAHYVLGCTPEELTTRVGTALIDLVPQPELAVAQVPAVRGKTAKAHKRLRKVALGGDTRGELSREGTKPRSKTGQWWFKLTKKQQAAIIARRIAGMRKTSALKKVKKALVGREAA